MHFSDLLGYVYRAHVSAHGMTGCVRVCLCTFMFVCVCIFLFGEERRGRKRIYMGMCWSADCNVL